ncbi:VCBS repeat-containing protein [Aquimarina sp. D1M17]|uniref:VCBS repeat-containing protein n=1 Tax=Aquimarina acroporae TaxID=2937283 RepID=UPI0020C08E5E|nr:FG-GAP-like repeat-containing protein [Aquimarina acroporae]MCK8521768.1 VCBS repeat-containing protein [Aquimarina acroporae]
MKVVVIYFVVVFLFLVGCSSPEKEKTSEVFLKLDSKKTGITFTNRLTENDTLNYFTYPYIYMGGGIAVGDINNDGLLDIYFTGNQVSNKLYLNKGNLEFEDITESAGVGGDRRWYTGVTMSDVNGDGFLDIYCSVGGKFEPKQNQLFINNGDATFSEKAVELGLADSGNSTQATFFDYDKDGDLDVYVANYPPTKFNSPVFVYQNKMKNVKDHESDHLYENQNGIFIDVTQKAGVKSFGLSLSATVGDINNDSWPDIYVSNDFSSPDYMYLNNQDGTFREVLKNATSQTAFYGMGVDIADFNNDGYLDIFQVDMDAKSNRRKKANMASMNIPLFRNVVNAGFHYQYMQNCLQLHTGVIEKGIPKFSNISRITGTSSTDWSWAPLIADFDNDGLKDLFVSNGTRREINNNDYFNKLDEFNSVSKDSLLPLSLKIPSEPIDNFMFKNQGDLSFEQVNDQWGIRDKGFSNGAVYADFDNDGDLEIITNNIDDVASFFENTSSKVNNYLKIKFEDVNDNKFGIGTRVNVVTGKKTQLQELTMTRGFQSSVAPEMIFGLGKYDVVDELNIIWPNGDTQILQNIKANQSIVVKSKDAAKEKNEKIKLNTHLFATTNMIFPHHAHVENQFDDFSKQILLPHKMSSFGPALAIGDLNGDGLEDYFVGGAKGYAGSIFLQHEGGFKKMLLPVLEQNKNSEDIGATIFDADNDGDNDLYVVSGGYEFAQDSENLQDRLYINHGNGNFSESIDALPKMRTSGSKVDTADFDKDGKKDVLVLGRQVPGKYPMPANTFILKNRSSHNQIKFDFSHEMQPEEFTGLGMATDAVITDFNNDNWPDVIVVGEWMQIRAFQNTKGKFKEVTKELGLEKTTSWWWSIEEGDFDNDGDMDYIVGNNGLNYKYKASEEETFDIFFNDFDNNDHNDIVLSYYNEGKQYPVRGRECSSQQVPGIKQKFQNYESFANATLTDVYSQKTLNSSLHYSVRSFASVFLENTGGKFVMHELPKLAQISSINQILVDDYDKDKHLDVLIAGNLFSSEVETPRNDAGYGLFLKGNGKGNFSPISTTESGFYVPGDVKDMKMIKVKDTSYIIAAKNNDSLQYIVHLKN